jgi:adenylate cyclase
MQAFVGNLIQRKPRRALSPEFKHALAREVLKTERLRIIALIITATVLAAGLTTADVVAPATLDRIWQGRFPVLYLLAGYVGFVLLRRRCSRWSPGNSNATAMFRGCGVI